MAVLGTVECSGMKIKAFVKSAYLRRVRNTLVLKGVCLVIEQKTFCTFESSGGCMPVYFTHPRLADEVNNFL